MTDMKVTKKSISERCNSFLNSNYAFLLLVLLLIIGVFNMLNFEFNNGSVSNPWFDEGSITADSRHSWIGMCEIIISTIGGITIVLSDILIIRYDKKFIIPLLIGATFTVIDAVLVGYLFTALSYIFMMTIGIYSYLQWGKDEDETNKMTKDLWMFAAILFLVYSLFGLLLIQTSGSNIGYPEKLESVWSWSDVLGSGVVLTSYFLMLNKSKYGFFGFVASDITYIFAYGVAGLWTSIGMYAIYLVFIDSPALLSWWESN